MNPQSKLNTEMLLTLTQQAHSLDEGQFGLSGLYDIALEMLTLGMLGVDDMPIIFKMILERAYYLGASAEIDADLPFF